MGLGSFKSSITTGVVFVFAKNHPQVCQDAVLKTQTVQRAQTEEMADLVYC